MPKLVENQYPIILPKDGQLRLAFVGEAPADEEVRHGRPFCAAQYGWNAGSELDLWFKAAGIIRQQCYIGNLSMEQAPSNQIKNMFLDSKCSIPKPNLVQYIEVLKQQLTELQPNCIIALGDVPNFVLTGKRGLFKKDGYYIGSILPCILVPSLKVIPISHPAFIIRGMYALRQVMVRFLKRAVQESNTKELNLPKHELIVDPDPDLIIYHLERLMNSPKIAFDIENPGRSPIVCISFSDSPSWSMSVPFTQGMAHRWHRSVEQEIWVKISKLLSGDALKIAHNLNYDFTWLTTQKIHVKPPYYDTMIAHHDCYPDLSRDELKKLKLNSLAFCTAFYTRTPYYKSDYKVDNEADPKWKGTEYEFWKYNAKDSVVAFEVQECTSRDLNTLNQTKLLEHDMSVWRPLMVMSLKGNNADLVAKEDLSKTARSYIKTVQNKLNTVAGNEVNVDAPADVKKLLYHTLALPIQFNKDTGKPTTDIVALNKLLKKTGNPVVQHIIDLRRLGKLKSTYIDTDLSYDGRYHTTYNQAKTTTFRLSSSAFVIRAGLNLQNIPVRKRDDALYDGLVTGYKKTFLPDKGMKLGKRDLKQAEAMVVAYLARDIKQIEDFANNIDTHSVAATYLFGKDYKTIYEGHKNGDPQCKMWRRFGKTVRHASNYRMGKRTLRDNFFKEGLDIPEKDCQRMLDAMKAGVPMVINWQAEVEHTIRENRTLITPLGRRRYFMGKLSDDVIREGIAFVPQCTVAHVLDIGLERCYNWLEDNNPTEFDLLMNIHDAVVWQSPEESIINHAGLIGSLMNVELFIHGRELIIPSDLAIGDSWGTMEEVKEIE